MGKVGRNNIITNLFFVGLAIVLGSVPLIAAENYARHKGPEYEKVIKIKVNYT
jgi:hypothetical protein